MPEGVRSDHVHELAAERSWRISAESFFQTRADGVDALARVVVDAAQEMGPATTAIDLYSGVGVFAGVLRGARVVGHRGRGRPAPGAPTTRSNLRDLDVKVMPRRRDEVDTTAPPTSWSPIRVAPASRRRESRQSRPVGARRVILVSCDAANLGRDAGLLREAGYAITAVTPVDLFPHTSHVEVVTVYDR